MNTYKVMVRRILREDTVITVKADSPKMAAEIATGEATSLPQQEWECYDCEYICDGSDAWEVVNGPA